MSVVTRENPFAGTVARVRCNKCGGWIFANDDKSLLSRYANDGKVTVSLRCPGGACGAFSRYDERELEITHVARSRW